MDAGRRVTQGLDGVSMRRALHTDFGPSGGMLNFPRLRFATVRANGGEG